MRVVAWLAVTSAAASVFGAVALGPQSALADDGAAANGSDCVRVGIRVMTDDLNVTRVVCGNSVTVETTSAPPTEAPTQYFPLGDGSG